jgi:LPS export ABC transporter protein LptC
MKRLIIFLGAAGTLAAAACSDAKKPPLSAAPSAADTADQVLYGVHYTLVDKSINRGELFADTMYVFDELSRFDLRIVQANFRNADGTAAGRMQAKKGAYSTRTQILEGWGNVVLTLTDGRQLKSPHVIYNRLANDVSSDTTYELSGPKGHATGKGFSADPNFTTRFQCKSNCSATGSVNLPSR